MLGKSLFVAEEDILDNLKGKLSQNAQILVAGCSGWSQALKSFNKDAQQQTPSFYIKCTSEEDVVQSILFARQNNLPLTARSGCHNLGNFSLLQGGVVIDVKRLNKINHSLQNQTITYQTGCKFGQIDEYVYSNLKGYAFMGAMDPSIGTAGARSALGVGWLQRLLGNGIDNIVNMKVCLADGSIVEANQSQNSDLFFALRGAASNFGIVLSITQKLHNILDPNQGQQVLYGAHFYPIDRAQQIYDQVLKINTRKDLPDTTFVLPVLHFVNEQRGLSIFFCHYKYNTQTKNIDNQAHWTQVQLKNIQAKYNGLAINHLGKQNGWGYISHIELQRKAMNIPWGSGFYPFGGFVEDQKVQKVANELIKHWRQSQIPQFAKNVPFHSTSFYHFGGKAQRNRNPSSTAWPGNQKTAVLAATWGGWRNPNQKQAMIKWVKEQWSELHKDLQFGYLCAANFDWKSKSYAKFTYNQNFERLQVVKAKYDPRNVFSHNVNIPPKHEQN